MRNEEIGEEIGLIGVHVKMDDKIKIVTLTQHKNVERIIQAFGPALPSLKGYDELSPLLSEQKKFHFNWLQLEQGPVERDKHRNNQSRKAVNVMVIHRSI
jgi:DNA-binding ferritin-like protein